jgi:3-methyladenine DNA glycosylase AlkD
MLSHADPAQVAGLARFFKTGPGQYGEGDRFLGIKVPVTREVVRECWKSVGFPELEECISSEYHEVRLAALLTLVEIFRHAGKRPAIRSRVTEDDCVRFYLNHTARINNWDLVDLSCYPILGEWLMDKDRSLLYDLAGNGKTIWEQRIGIVSTMAFIRHGQLQDTFAIADILLQHPHDLIRKAVGWLLREAGKRDRPALEAWLLGTQDQIGSLASVPRCRRMPRTMLRYAIEKFPEAERKVFLTK